MADITIHDFHAHIYYDPEEVERAKALAAEVQRQFGVAVGHFHLKPVGPHPRGSCQLTIETSQLAEVLPWLVLNRGKFTVFTHAQTGNALKDHTQHVVWLGPSETLKLDQFR